MTDRYKLCVCVGSEEVARFRAHPTSVDFRRKWNVGIYYSLRFQSLAGAVETSITRYPHIEYSVLLPVPFGTPLPTPPAPQPAVGSVGSGLGSTAGTAPSGSGSGGGIAVALPITGSPAPLSSAPASSAAPALASDALHNELINYTQSPLPPPLTGAGGAYDLSALVAGSAGTANPHAFALEASVTLWRTSEIVWNDRGGVWLPQFAFASPAGSSASSSSGGGNGLVSKWLRLTVQVWTRYCTWMSAALPAATPSAADDTKSDSKSAPVSSPAAATTGDEKDGADGASGSGDDSSVAACTWSGQPITAQTLLFAWFDVTKLRSRLLTQLMPEIVKRIISVWPITSGAGQPASPTVQLAIRKSIDAAFQSTLERLSTLAATIWDSVVAATARRCTDVLSAHVTKIKQQYRMTNKPPPTRPSPYVMHVLAPARIVLAIDSALAVGGSTAGAAGTGSTASASNPVTAFVNTAVLIHNPVTSTATAAPATPSTPPVTGGAGGSGAAPPPPVGGTTPASATATATGPNPISVAANVLIRQQLPPTHRDAQRFVEAVIKRATTSFQARCSELLDIVTKIDVSLKRLTARAAATATASATAVCHSASLLPSFPPSLCQSPLTHALAFRLSFAFAGGIGFG